MFSIIILGILCVVVLLFRDNITEYIINYLCNKADKLETFEQWKNRKEKNRKEFKKNLEVESQIDNQF